MMPVRAACDVRRRLTFFFPSRRRHTRCGRDWSSDVCSSDYEARDVIYTKRMPSAFFETPLQSLLVWHQADTVILTGGSTSGCIRATAVESLSRGYRTIVPEQCVADKHESYHYANLTDLHLKYADVMNVQSVLGWLDDQIAQKG